MPKADHSAGISRPRLLATAALVAAAGYLVASPYLTAYQMQRAADARDGEALSEHVDFPAVRQHLKDQMNAEVARKIGSDGGEDNPLAALGATFGSLVIDRMVDAFITPAGIARMMEGDVPEPAGPAAGNGDEAAARKPFSDASMRYEGLSKFVVTVRDADTGDDIRFVLRRRGLAWQLTEIWLPL